MSAEAFAAGRFDCTFAVQVAGPRYGTHQEREQVKDMKHAIIATIAATLCFATAASASDVVRDVAPSSRDVVTAGGATPTFHWTTAVVPTPGTLALLALAGCIGLTARTKG